MMENGLTIQPKTPAMVRREMAKIPAVMDALGPVERIVFMASTAKPFSEYSETELATGLATILKWIAKDVGFRATDESETQYLIIRTAEILKRYYGNLSLKDFRMAFEMAVTGELDEFLPKGRDGQADRGHYQQFNAEYVCKILNAYKARRGWILKKANEAMPKHEPAPNPEQQRYYRNKTRQDCIHAFEFFKDNGHLPDMSPIGELLCYNTLSDVGLAKEIVVTLDDQRAVMQQTINEYARGGFIGHINRLKADGPESKELEHKSYILARRKALEKAFKWMVEQDININDYIKFEDGRND